jgi:hypothetical protein
MAATIASGFITCEYRRCRHKRVDQNRRSFCEGHNAQLREAGFIPSRVVTAFRWNPEDLCRKLPLRRVTRAYGGARGGRTEELVPWYLSTLWNEFGVGPRLRSIYSEIGLPDDVADEWAVHFGLLPHEVWHDWFERAELCTNAAGLREFAQAV